ncbi:MAG: hypothetical protein DYG89_16790 [Caldilinea sp. CFX5]|nr:hypothetical protein [Caldilinea sp. CFX5]
MAKLLRKLKQAVEQRFQSAKRPDPELQRSLAQAEQLMAARRAREVIDLLTPLKPRYPRSAELHYYLGYASALAGDLWGGLAGYEQALALTNDTAYWEPLASIYSGLELRAHALTAFRQLQRQTPEHPMFGKVSLLVAELATIMQEMADEFGCPVATFEQACREMERSQVALASNDFAASIQANQRALRLVEQWPPPRNNLALAYFYNGQPAEAIAAACKVLTYDPDNLQALSNLVRFLDWTGETAAAHELWPRLQPLVPEGPTESLKKAEALAALQKDQEIRQLLQPLAKDAKGEQVLDRQILRYLAVAEANSGDLRSAKRHLRAIPPDSPLVDQMQRAVQANKAGPGWATRYPYVHSTELLPRTAMDDFIKLVGRHNQLPERAYRKQIQQFAERYPQLVLVGEKLIWEEEQVNPGIALLQTLATPAAFAVLRHFALSQAGDDETRVKVVGILQDAGQLAHGEVIRLWQRGQWREIQLQKLEITEDHKVVYAPRVADLIDRGLDAIKRKDDELAEKLLRQAVALEPGAKEAYNNLGVIYSQRNNQTEARAMFQVAADLDPTYVFPRANLVIYLLRDKNVEGAKEMLKPLVAGTQRTPQEMAFYLYAQAQIQMAEDAHEDALASVNGALQLNPDLAPAKELQTRLERYLPLMTNMKAFQERQEERDQKQRLRFQSKLTTAEPTLAETLAIYTKEALLAMARALAIADGLTGLRKAEVYDHVVAALREPTLWQQVIPTLFPDDRRALQAVMAQGGQMPWASFSEQFGHDLDESPYWQYREPQSVMGRLRLRGLLVEATVKKEVLIVVPMELRPILQTIFREEATEA